MSDVSSPARTRRRWPLYVSLFLNVVLLTVLAIGAWRVHQFRSVIGADAGMNFWLPRQLERALPEGPREKVRKIREAHAGELRPLFEAAGKARQAVRVAFDAEPFDAQALRAALKAMREADGAVAQATGDMIVEIVEALTPEERGRVRQALRERGPRKPFPGHDGGGRQGPPGPPDEPPGPPPGEGAAPMPPPDDLPPPPPDGTAPSQTPPTP